MAPDQQIKIKRISKYDVKEQDEKLTSLEAQIEEIDHHLAHIRQFAINYFKELLKKYGKGRERKTKIDSFEAVVASEVIINNQKLYVNREEGFAGYGMMKDEFLCECSDLDEIIAFRGDGTMIVTKVDEKKYVRKDVRHIALFRKSDPEVVYNLVYQDGRGGNAMVKRFTVGGTTRDKEYVLTKATEGSKVLQREKHNVREAKDGQYFGQRARGNARGSFRTAGGAQNADKFCVGRGHRRVSVQQVRCRRPNQDSG